MKKRNIKYENERVERNFPENPNNISKEELHEHFDLNQDGKVTIEEYAEHINYHCDNPETLSDELDYERGFKYAKGGEADNKSKEYDKKSQEEFNLDFHQLNDLDSGWVRYEVDNEGYLEKGGEISLYFQQGGSDKEYHIQMEEEDGGYVVNFQYGRRGRGLKSGTKTASPVSLQEAEKIYDKLLNSKVAKGYSVGQKFSGNIPTQKTIHKLPQLLNIVFTTAEFINDDSYLAQEKRDGERRMVMSNSVGTTGLNKKGQEVPLPNNIVDSINDECIIDGEIIGDTLYAFDILSLNGKNLEGEPCIERISTLNTLRFGEGVIVVETAYNTEEKQEMFDKLEREHREGIVFKKKDSTYIHGRPSSGGTQLKYKFYKTATFIVANHTPGKRSVGLELIDNGQKVFMGKVTIPPNKEIPNVGDLVEVRYLYAYKGGAVYQPTYIWKREDSDLTDATIDQIIYKAEDYSKGGVPYSKRFFDIVEYSKDGTIVRKIENKNTYEAEDIAFKLNNTNPVRSGYHYVKMEERFAKGGKVEKKGNEIIIGGLAGILLGVFFNK
jgi:bifunctional non-homologous end joining protein LigD